MEIVKKNWLSILFGVIALIALVAWIWPLGSIQAEAEKDLDQRVGVASSMQQLVTTERQLPAVSLTGDDVKPLGMFPTQRVIDWGKTVSEQLATEAKNVRQVAARMNARALLVPESLPEPRGTTEFTFRDLYNRYVSEFPSRVGAGQPPTAEDFQKAIKELWDTRYEPQMVYRGNQPDPITQRQLTEDFQKEQVDVPERVKQQRARSILYYMPAEAIARSPLVMQTPAGTSLQATAIWDAQMRIWVQNDILQAIVDLNTRESKTKSVIDAPVKHLLSTKIDQIRGAKAVTATTPGMPGMMGPPDMMGMGGFGPPPEALAMMGGPMGMMGAEGAAAADDPFTASVTGRKSNALYDVVPFTIVVHVEAAKLPLFIEELGRNRFLTVTQVSNMKAINSVIYNHQYNVVYGSAPVVEATINGEALLLRDWTVPLMPKDVRQSVGVDSAEAAPAQ